MGIAEDESLRNDLGILAQQEALLRFERFDADIAWQLGSLLRGKLLACNAGATVEIELDRQLLFACATAGAKPNQADWIRRKRNTVHRFNRSTYWMGRELALAGQTLEAAHGLAEVDYATHGGGFPVRLGEALDKPGDMDICAGSIVLSGLPQREDHNLVVAAMAEVLGVAVPMLA